MDQKGQISAELVLLIGVIFVVILVIATYVGQESEANTITVAAKEGALEALSNLSLTNRNIEPVTVQSIDMIGTGDITIQIKLSHSLPNQTEYILNSVFSYIQAQGFTRNTGSNANTSSDDYIVAGRHNYTITIV